jgi:putative DNA primase/helicase
MRRDPFTFTPTWTLCLIGNQKPDATTGGPAFWRRMKMLPFAHVVPEGDRDPNLPDKLLEEAPAILAWIARGAALYHQQGLATPDIVSSTTEAYRHDQDTVERFVSDQCHRAASDVVRVSITHLRDAYEAWCKQNSEAPVSSKRLTQDLHDKYGIESVKGSKGQRFYMRICLLTDEEGQL